MPPTSNVQVSKRTVTWFLPFFGCVFSFCLFLNCFRRAFDTTPPYSAVKGLRDDRDPGASTSGSFDEDGDCGAVWDASGRECTQECGALRRKLLSLELSNDAIWAREHAREEIPAPWIIKAPYLVLCVGLDTLYGEERPIQRFWFLETVARMPYFAYTTCLHLYGGVGGCPPSLFRNFKLPIDQNYHKY